MKIHILDITDYSKKAIGIYQKLGSVTSGLEPIVDTEVLVIRLHKCNKEMMDSLPKLRVIAFNATGQDHVDIEYAQQKGIQIFSLKDDRFNENVPASSEHAFGLMLALSRNYKHAFQFPNNPKPRFAYKGHDIKGKTLGIIGFGRIGRKVYHMAYAFGMDINHYDINELDSTSSREYTIKTADFLLLSLTLDSGTKNSFKLKDFQAMKDTAYLINVSRGEIIKKDALLDSLINKRIAGAGIDVTREDDRKELIEYAKRYDNLIVTNHIAGCTHESSHITEERIAERVFNCFNSENKE